MNLGLTTSYIIAGILLLSILMMNLSVTNSSIQLTQRQMNQQKLSTVTDMISNDIQKMGADTAAKTDTILLEATDNRIKFKSNIDNEDKIETVSWEFEKTEENEVTGTENPDDYILWRIVRDDETDDIIEETPIRLGVTEFSIQYYDSYGVPKENYMNTPLSESDREEVKQLYIKINLESPEKTYDNPDDEGDYVLSVWEKRFSPPNLECSKIDSRPGCDDE